MEVILLQKVANLGNIGDRVKVRSGYGRNFLLPEGKATLATPDNVARFEARRAELERLAREHLHQRRGARRGAEGIQAHHPRQGRHRGQAVRLHRHRRHRRGRARARASRSSAAKCACRPVRCAWWVSTSSACTCTPTSTCRCTSPSWPKSKRRPGTQGWPVPPRRAGSQARSPCIDAPTPPHSVEAEQAVLGGLLLDPAAWDSVADRVVADDFYRPDHRLIFAAIGELAGDGQALRCRHRLAAARAHRQARGRRRPGLPEFRRARYAHRGQRARVRGHRARALAAAAADPRRHRHRLRGLQQRRRDGARRWSTRPSRRSSRSPKGAFASATGAVAVRTLLPARHRPDR